MRISIIIPCFNNEESIAELFNRLEKLAQEEIFGGHAFELVLVDDGSKDNTYGQLVECAQKSPLESRVVKLTRNFGSYNAFLAGMNYATGDCNVHLHADLQDPPELISQLFEHYLKGFKLVIANRSSREDASIFSSIYHKLVKRFAIKNTPDGGFDLILFDRKIKDEVLAISEKQTNNVYLINWLGYPYVSIPYKRLKRKHGKSQWAFWKKVHLFADTFFSFSDLPLKLIRYLFVFSALLFLVANYLFFFVSEMPHRVIIYIGTAIIFFCSINFVILSEFLSRIHETVRRRPSFVVEKVEEIK